MAFALAVMIDGIATGWDEVNSKEQAVKVAYERSMTDCRPQYVLSGKGPQDEDANVEYLVVGGNFYVPHDL